jgi:hypothetical protein
MAKWDLSKLPEGRKPLPDEWFRERAQMQERIEERQKHLQTMWGLWIKAETQNAEYLGRIEELEAKLAWAVGELEEMLMLKNSEAAYGTLMVYTKALVAELKGKTNE